MNHCLIGLGVPETAFSREHGLRWDDNVGFSIATRAGVQPLGPDYERVLLKYYTHLWRRHPVEMFRTYVMKFRYACGDVFLSAGIVLRQYGIESPLFRWLNERVSGFTLFLGTATVGWLGWSASTRGTRLGFLLAFTSLGALLTLLESALTYSGFGAIYFSYFLFFLLLVAAMGVQFLFDMLVSVALWALHRHVSGASTPPPGDFRRRLLLDRGSRVGPKC